MDLPYLGWQYNVSNRVTAEYIQDNMTISIIVLIILIIAMISGCFGNILVILAVLIDRNLRTVGNIFIVNLALADLCVAGFVDPFSIIGLVEGEIYFYGRLVLCEVVASLCLASCFVSLLSILFISINRYVFIVHSQLYHSLFSLRNSLILCAVLWVVGFSAEMPNLIGWGDHTYDRKTLTCIWDRTADLSYTIFVAVVPLGIPIVLTSVFYGLIFWHVRSSKRKVQQTASSAEKGTFGGKERRDGYRLARTLFMIFVVFAICWSPYAVIIVADVNDSYPDWLHTVAITMAHTNSSLNCLLYGITNKQFRKAYLHITFLDRCPCFKEANPQESGKSYTVNTLTKDF